MTSTADRRILLAAPLLVLLAACGGGDGQPLTDEEAVAAATAGLVIGYQAGDSAPSVTRDVTLTTTGLHGTTVAWASSGQAVATSGIVVRPAFGAGNAAVTLTATVTRGDALDTKLFEVTVLETPPTDAQAVALAKTALEIGYQAGDSASNVTQDVTLSTTGLHGTTVAWASSRPAYVGTSGAVARPSAAQGDTAVTVTATLTRGPVSDTKAFALTVKQRTDVSWVFVDGNLATGLNYSTVRNAVDPALAALGQYLYVAWTENAQIRVRRFDGATWIWLDGGGATGINHDPTESAFQPSLAVFGGSVHAIFSELYSGASVTRVKRYDGGSATWISIDGSATNGLNRQSVTSQDPTMGVCDGTLYASWVEAYGGAMQLRVKRYDGGAWAFVDGGALTGLNYDTGRSATDPKLGCLEDVLHLVWTETDASSTSQVRVRRYDGGSTWAWIGGGAGSGLNYSSAQSAAMPGLVVLEGTLHAYWVENHFVRVKRYAGGAWSTADGDHGFKQNADNYVYQDSAPVAVPSGSGTSLLFTWGEDVTQSPWAYQTRAATYDGSAMTFLDGNDSTVGLNKELERYARGQQIALMDGSIWIAWYETDGTADQIRVIRGQ